jgi:hypothetical protein
MSAAPFFDFTQPLTLTAAATLPPTAWAALSVPELDLSGADRERLAGVWLWLCGVAPNSAAAGRVRREVLNDAPLMVALSLPGVELLRWLRRAAWEDFDSTERTGSEAWAWEALQKVWAVCDAMGHMATQCPVPLSLGAGPVTG